MPLSIPLYTVDDLDSFPDDGNRYELLDGVLLVSPAPSFRHDLVVTAIRDQLIAYLGRRAFVFGRGTVEIRPRNHLEPDLLVLPRSGKYKRDTPWSDITGFWLAVEVSGRGSRIYDRDFKLKAYPRLGVAESWRADLRDQVIDVVRPGSSAVELVRDRLVWQPPGFDEPLVIDVREVFADVEDDE